MWRTLSIDPSIKAAGWAVHTHSTRTPHNPAPSPQLKASGIIRPPRPPKGAPRWTWIRRAEHTAEDLADLANRYNVSVILIELPRHYSHAGGKAEAAKNTGSILKLMYQIACIRTRLLLPPHEFTPGQVKLIPVHTWKGQTPKKVTQLRFYRKHRNFTTKTPKSLVHNEIDAISLGDSYAKILQRKIKV